MTQGTAQAIFQDVLKTHLCRRTEYIAAPEILR